AEFKRVRPLFAGDFYPLTPYSVAATDWMAYQYHREDLREGMVIAFRRSRSPDRQLRLKLGAVSPRASYELRFIDEAGATRTTRARGLDQGLDLVIDDPAGSLLVLYRQVGR
ncbi:MAG: alpha-galactosidase, partial [Verrucomicrobiota bacterium]